MALAGRPWSLAGHAYFPRWEERLSNQAGSWRARADGQQLQLAEKDFLRHCLFGTALLFELWPVSICTQYSIGFRILK